MDSAFWSIDLWPLTAGVLVALTCGLIGNFLLLRRLSLMGDAISHSVVPGIVAAFLISNSRTSAVVFLGAAVAGVLTTVLVEAVRRLGRLEAGAAMGVVFSILFALGILLMEQAAARHIDLDADCLLHGQIETLVWFPPKHFADWFSVATLKLIPGEIGILFFTLVAILLFLKIFFKELTLSAFDSGLCDALGFSSRTLHYLLMVMVALTVVASFFSVGSILVIAMLICPAACARHFTDRLKSQLALSALFSVMMALGGYGLATALPPYFGFSQSLSVSGMMTVAAGGLLTLSCFFAPKYGIVAKIYSRLQLSLRIAEDDLYGFLYRLEEVNKKDLGLEVILDGIGGGRIAHFALKRALKRQWITKKDAVLELTPPGRARAQSIVRTHRLWETFLNRHLGLPADHLHVPAERLEHFTRDKWTEDYLAADGNTELDPHGKPIPPQKS